MKYYLGIDGGGTKTRAVLINSDLEVLSDLTYDTTYIITIGEEKFVNILKNIYQDALHYCQKIEFVFLGIAGHGEFSEDSKLIERLFKSVFTNSNVEVTNDSIAAWAGSLMCQDGISVITGTGSIIAGVKDKIYKRVGGWGYIIGDEGSAYWIATKVINVYSKMFDNRLEKSILFDMINNEYNLDNENNFVKLIYRDMDCNRSKIASLATLCTNAAINGCIHCINILREAADEMTHGIETVAKEMHFSGPIPVSYAGGVYKSSVYLKYFKENLESSEFDFELITPVSEPAFGAALYAYILDGNTIDDNLRQKYLQNCIKKTSLDL